MANGLQTSTVFSVLIIESMYYLLITSTHIFSSIIMITFQLATLVKIKSQNQFAIDILSLASILIYNNSTSSMSLVYNLNYNVTSLTDLSSNFLFPNDYGIPFLQTLSRNFCYSLNLILFWSQSTGTLSKQFLSLFIILLYLQTQHICLSFICFSNMVFLPMLSLTEV